MTGDDAQRPGRSREASNALLGELRHGGFRPAAWRRFLAAAAVRSVKQAATHRRAFAEATGLHLILAIAADKGSRGPVALSWLLTVTHLGMLEDHRSLGLPNGLTLVRANLPALTPAAPRSSGAGRLATDLLDGRIARARHLVTPFGAAADFLADAIVWNSLLRRRASAGWLRAMAVAAWLVPVAGVAALSFSEGSMRDIPRSRLIRPAAAAEVLIGFYLLTQPPRLRGIIRRRPSVCSARSLKREQGRGPR